MGNNSHIEVHHQEIYTSNNVEKIRKVEENCCNTEISSIYRVPKQLREMNPKAYVPQVISIGPFHHHTQKDLKVTEQYKVQGFKNFLRRMNNNNNKMESLEEGKSLLLKVLVEKDGSLVEKVRNSYAEPIIMNNENFIKMMLVDGCFIVEYFIQRYDRCNPTSKFLQIQDNVDLSFYQGISFNILYDLVKLENQVPFFLLQSLYELISNSAPISFKDLTTRVLSFGFLGKYKICHKLSKEPTHFVDFFCFRFLPLPNPDIKNNQDEESLSCIHSYRRLLQKRKNQENYNEDQEQWIHPPSVSELCEAGVTIKKAENTKCLMNISFKNGVLEIPPLYITDSFELVMRNMIAFEHFPAGNKICSYVTQYVSFLDDLISTEKDVCLLVKAGVLMNEIGGSDKEVSDLFNNLCKFVTTPSSSHFNGISTDLLEHCNGWWNRSKASLKHNYFNTPWAVISFFAATFLILLTLLQTIFSAISAFHS